MKKLFICFYYETYLGKCILKCFIAYLLFIQIYRRVLCCRHKMARFPINTLLHSKLTEAQTHNLKPTQLSHLGVH